MQLDISQSAGLLWTRDRPVTEAWLHATLLTDRHTCPGGIRKDNSSKRVAADPCLRRLGQYLSENSRVLLLLLRFIGALEQKVMNFAPNDQKNRKIEHLVVPWMIVIIIIIIIIIIICFCYPRTTSKSFRKYFSNVPGKHEIKATLNSHIGHCTHTSECTNVEVQKM